MIYASTPAEVIPARNLLEATIYGSLTDLANAREYAASNPVVATPKDRELCGACGGGDKSHPSWLSKDARCASSWHSMKP